MQRVWLNKSGWKMKQSAERWLDKSGWKMKKERERMGERNGNTGGLPCPIHH